MALGLLSRRESRKGSLAEVDNTTTTLLYANPISSDAARCLKMLKMIVFDRTRPSLYSGISAAQSTYTTHSFDTDAYLF